MGLSVAKGYHPWLAHVCPAGRLLQQGQYFTDWHSEMGHCQKCPSDLLIPYSQPRALPGLLSTAKAKLPSEVLRRASPGLQAVDDT